MTKKPRGASAQSRYYALCADLDTKVRNVRAIVCALSASYDRTNGITLPERELGMVLDLAVDLSGEMETAHADLIQFTDRHI